MDFTGFSASATVNLVNNGRIMGCGGSGGDGGFAQDTSDGGELIKFPRAGTSGGDAIKGPGAGVTFSITNAQGRIYGGGGGGGGGGLSHTDNSTSHAVGGGGGGGAGGGRAGRGDKVGDQFNSATSTDGGNGTFVDAAAGGTGGTGGEQGGSDDGGNGGAGGDWGANGTIGDSPTGADIDITGGSAGLAGKAINQAGGTASFVSGSGSPNVKGAVT
jgi:hypothetical protein